VRGSTRKGERKRKKKKRLMGRKKKKRERYHNNKLSSIEKIVFTSYISPRA